MLKHLTLTILISTLLISPKGFSRNIHFSQADLETQYQRSISLLLQNISRPDTAAGSIVAAPSHNQPDYYYHWIRDAALTSSSLMSLYSQSKNPMRSNLKNFLLDHVGFNIFMQENLTTLSGVGEPKFNMDGSVFMGPWGRPQNDGPALRASGMIDLLAIMKEEKWPELENLSRRMYDGKLPSKSLIKTDLEYTAHHWTDLCFDLWEEVNGMHFYTLMSQRKGLQQGEALARSLGDLGAADFYKEQLVEINAYLEKFWNQEQGFIEATLFPKFSLTGRMGGKISTMQNRSGLDTAVLLSVLHSSLADESFSVDDPRVQATYNKLREAFAQSYSINKNPSLGTAFGRYPEDTYNGYEVNSLGNPWVLSTAGASEYLYRLIEQIVKKQTIQVTQTNYAFYQHVSPLTRIYAGQTITGKSPIFKSIILNLFSEADSMLERILYHKNPDGSLSEQFNRENGYMQGAPNLTWSHASLITAKQARDRVQTLFFK